MNKKELIIPILSISFIYIGNTLYEWSLEGKKDIDWMHHHLKIFGIEIFLASILFFLGFFLLGNHIIKSIYNNNNNNNNINENNSNNNNNFSPKSNGYQLIKNNFKNLNINSIRSTKTIYQVIIISLFIFCIISTFYQITKDIGATLVKHGQYNLLVLSGLLIFYTSTYLTWWILLKFFNFKQILIGFLVIGIVFFIGVEIKNSHEKTDWPIGIDGKKLMFSNESNPNVCKIPKDFIIWPAFQPKGSTYVVTGSRDCPTKDTQFSELDKDNILHINCNQGEQASYTTSPTWFEEQKQAGIFTNDFKTFEKQYNKKTYQYKEPTVIGNDETVLAQCGNRTEIHFQNLKKPSSYFRARNFNNPTILLDKDIKQMKSNERKKPVDILFLMIDALSRAHFKRALPLTFDTIQSIQDEGHSKVFQFFRYHSLKPFTDPNTIAMYTGYNSLSYDHIDKEIVPEEIQPKRTHQLHSWDKNPMFFQSFRNDSYITSWIYGLCEDWFQAYLKKDKPEGSIDHEMVLPFCSPIAFPLDRPFGIFEGPYSIRRRCLGNKHIHDRIFDYINQIWDNYKDVGKIVTATFMDAHEGTMEVINIADKQFNRFIDKDLKSKLNDTVLVITGDHGNHMGGYYNWAKGGKVEVAMPVLYIIIPTWFTNKYPNIEKNLLANENKLASPFQLYDTIRALSKFPEFGGIDVYDTNNSRNDDKHLGLLGNIPDDVQCSDLGIPHDFCQCFENKYNL